MSRLAIRNLVVGLFVIGGLACLAWLSISVGGLELRSAPKHTLYAHFDELGGLSRRAQVQVAGVKIGEVVGIELDEDYRARVQLLVDASVELPIDTGASILTAGILGDKLIALQIGGEFESLKDGETIEFTESALILERLIGKLIHNTSVGDDE
jgi:phospholipid/cholesterol/gamma-HCH transport system substrate-binding protein